ncbi:MAG: RBB1NT (NUC162) domain [Paramarteilia canceri]
MEFQVRQVVYVEVRGCTAVVIGDGLSPREGFAAALDSDELLLRSLDNDSTFFLVDKELVKALDENMFSLIKPKLNLSCIEKTEKYIQKLHEQLKKENLTDVDLMSLKPKLEPAKIKEFKIKKEEEIVETKPIELNNISNSDDSSTDESTENMLRDQFIAQLINYLEILNLPTTNLHFKFRDSSEIDLFNLYLNVNILGGERKVINNNQWSEIVQSLQKENLDIKNLEENAEIIKRVYRNHLSKFHKYLQSLGNSSLKVYLSKQRNSLKRVSFSPKIRKTQKTNENGSEMKNDYNSNNHNAQENKKSPKAQHGSSNGTLSQTVKNGTKQNGSLDNNSDQKRNYSHLLDTTNLKSNESGSLLNESDACLVRMRQCAEINRNLSDRLKYLEKMQ